MLNAHYTSYSKYTMSRQAILTDEIIIVVSRLVDDAQTETREPSHSDIEFQIDRSGLASADPKRQGQLVGKAKRVRGTLSWAIESNPPAGERLVANLLAMIRGFGGFRESSPNYVGAQPIEAAIDAFKEEGFLLTRDGVLRPAALDALSGRELTQALRSYIRRARRGIQDAALVAGTGKDLLEATAAHVLTEKNGTYPQTNFPALLGMAFTSLGLATPQHAQISGETPQKQVERAMYELGCRINRLRNKEGIGHGRPWLPSVSETEARIALEFMGTISERLLAALEEQA